MSIAERVKYPLIGKYPLAFSPPVTRNYSCSCNCVLLIRADTLTVTPALFFTRYALRSTEEKNTRLLQGFFLNRTKHVRRRGHYEMQGDSFFK